MEPLYYRR